MVSCWVAVIDILILGKDNKINKEIKTHQCTAYEVTSLARQKVCMENNPAYEDTRLYSSAVV